MTHQVQIQGTTHAFEINDDESVIDAATRAGLMLPHSCRSGTCGTCMGAVVEGQIHYPNGLPAAIDAEQDAMARHFSARLTLART
jgi:Ferredoxin